MRPRVVVLGAGFGGLELTAMLSEALGAEIELVLIDQADSFVFVSEFTRRKFTEFFPDFARAKPGTVLHPSVAEDVTDGGASVWCA